MNMTYFYEYNSLFCNVFQAFVIRGSFFIITCPIEINAILKSCQGKNILFRLQISLFVKTENCQLAIVKSSFERNGNELRGMEMAVEVHAILLTLVPYPEKFCSVTIGKRECYNSSLLVSVKHLSNLARESFI